MKVKIHTIPADAQSFWREIGDTVHIWVNEDLDELARHRYIQQAKREYGITEERRRRRLIPLLPIRYGDTASAPTAATAVAVGGGVLAVGVAAAVVLPSVLTNDGQTQAHRPRTVAPARPSAPPTPPRKPPREPAGPPDVTPSRPDRSAGPPSHGLPPGIPALHLPAVPRHPISHTVPVDGIGSIPKPPRVPGPPKPPALPPSDPPTRARPLLRVDLPPLVHARTRVSPHLQIRVLVGRKPAATPEP